jgi:hypothetical protein
VVNDLLGGDLMLAEVLWPDGARQGVHYWNLLPDRSELDLTLCQFTSDEMVQPGHVLPRPAGPLRRCQTQYALLLERVLTRVQAAGTRQTRA